MFLNTAPAGQQDPVIAGSHSGKSVSVTPQAKPVYDELKRLSDRGNHWARLTVQGIQSLVAGRLHQNNIFIHPGAVHRGGTEEFVVMLPGCKVTVEKLASDGFRVLHFEADLNYFELQKNALKPGLYEVKSGGASHIPWSTSFKKDGKVSDSVGRMVMIADHSHESPDNAAVTNAPRLAKLLGGQGKSKLKNSGFDLHYTAGTESIGGMKQYRKAISPLKQASQNESAILLASTMYNARDIEGVEWISEFGGSGVFTQAMKILVDQGVHLEGHYVQLIRPTTAPSEALRLAHQLKLTIGDKFADTAAFDYIGNRDHLECIGLRLKSEQDYKLVQAGMDSLGLMTNVYGAVGVVLSVAGVTLSGGAFPAVAAFLGACAKGALAVKAGDLTAKQIMPHKYDRWKSKF